MREAVHAASGPAGDRIAAGVETFARRAEYLGLVGGT